MKHYISDGVYPVMVTPFNNENKIDYNAVKKLVHWYIDKGCEGLFAVCQSSEMFFLSLEERIALADTVIRTARERNPQVSIVVSGHISDSLEEQSRELNAMAALQPDAVVLVSNRLDIDNEGDDVWIANAEKLLATFPKEIPLGIYECPYSYKRLLSSRILEWCKQSGRFQFIKDTCCDPGRLAERLAILKGSGIKLYNANGQTLLYTLQRGAAGYSGVMANFHPELYRYLCKNFEAEPEKCQKLQEVLSLASFTECLAYPVTSKYYLDSIGIEMELNTRTRPMSDLKEYDKYVVMQMGHLVDEIKKELKIG